MENIQAKAIDLHDPEAQEEWIRLLRRRGELVEGREHAWRSYFILADHLSSCPTPLEVSMQRILSFPETGQRTDSVPSRDEVRESFRAVQDLHFILHPAFG